MRPICSLVVLLSGFSAWGQMSTGEISGNVQDFILEIGDKTEVVTIQIEGASGQLESAEIRDVIARHAPRNAVIGPGLQEFDLSLQKEMQLSEKATLQFRAEAYNLFNHPNLNIPNRIAFTANFGSISSAQDSRQLQLALKLAF